MLRRVLILMMLVGLLAACDTPEVEIEQAYIAASAGGSERTETYFPDETFYAFLRVSNVTENTEFEAVWTAVEVAEVEPNTEIDRYIVAAENDGSVSFSLTNQLPWGIGRYQVEIYLEGALQETLTFDVIPAPEATPEATEDSSGQ